MIDVNEAAESLDIVYRVRRSLAAARPPVLRHLLFALLAGFLVAIPALRFTHHGSVAVVTIIAALALKNWDRRRTGFFVSGWRPGATRPLTAAMAVLLAALAMGSLFSARDARLWWAPLVLGSIAAVVALGYSYYWQRIYSLEMRSAA